MSNFYDDLRASQTPAILKLVWQCVSDRFPDALAIIPAHQKNDRLGVDFWIEFQGGKMERLDAKIRKLDYSSRGDARTACLELLANCETGKPGWTVDAEKKTDWVLFLYRETGKYFFYRAGELRSIVTANLPHLRTIGKPALQRTATQAGCYTSETLFIDHRTLGKLLYLRDRGQLTLPLDLTTQTP